MMQVDVSLHTEVTYKLESNVASSSTVYTPATAAVKEYTQSLEPAPQAEVSPGHSPASYP